MTWASFRSRLTTTWRVSRAIRDRVSNHLADGTIRWIHSRGQCFRDAGGKAVRMAGATNDVSERKRAEDALRQSEKRFALAVAGSNDGIVDWDVVNDRMYSSPRAMRIMGIESDVTVRSRAEWRDLVKYHPDDVQRVRDDLQHFLDGQVELREGEYRVLLPNGECRWIRHRNKCVRDQARAPYSSRGLDQRYRCAKACRRSVARVAGALPAGGGWIERRHVGLGHAQRDVFLLGPRAGAAWARSRRADAPSNQWWTLFAYHPEDEKRVKDALAAYLRRRRQVVGGRIPAASSA